MKVINVGLIGFGTVGSGVARYLLENNSELRKKTSLSFNLLKIAEKKKKKVPSKYRPLIVSCVEEIIEDPDIDVIIEVIGGIHPAKEYVLRAIKNKKHVITANKALLAEEGRDIFKAAAKNRVFLKYEAAVCAGMPIIKSLKESLLPNEIESILGIVNGTSNYILTVMEEENVSMNEALKIAKKKGFAERNPVLDLEGIDSAHKLAILIKLAFGITPKFSQVYKEGITQISNLDIRYALELGYRIKLLSLAKKSTSGFLEARVHPTLLPLDHMLSSVRGVYNAVYIKANLVGEMLFYGQGAGKSPTTSAIISDLIDLGYISENNYYYISQEYLNRRIRGIKSIKNITSRYYVRFMAVDKPGVLAKISGILGVYNISIASVTQKERRRAKSVPIVMMTHEACEKNMLMALEKIERLNVITRKPVCIRVEV